MTRGLAFAIDFATTNPFLLFWVPLGVNLGGEREEQLGVNRWVRMLTFGSSDDTYLNSANISTNTDSIGTNAVDILSNLDFIDLNSADIASNV